MDINIASSTAAVRKTPVVQSPAELTAANEDAHTNKCIVCECTTWHSPSIVTLAWWKKNNISYPLMKIAGKHWECMFGKGSLHCQALQTKLKGGKCYERQELLTWRNYRLTLPGLLVWHLSLTSHHLCIISPSLPSPRTRQQQHLPFSCCSLCFISSHVYSPPPPSPSLPPSLYLIHCSDTVSHWCSHYSAQDASLLNLPVMHFQCIDHLTCHVVMSPPWVASLCELFRNAWILSVLLYSFHHYSLHRKSSSSRPPLASPAVPSQTDEYCCCHVTTTQDCLDPKAM